MSVKFVAVSTVRDEGAAEVAREALHDADIAVELRRVGANPYFGQMSAVEYEVRVPEDRVAEAHDVLARVELEAEEAAVRESGAGTVAPEGKAPTAAADAADHDAAAAESPGAQLAWRLVWIGVALAVVAFFAYYLWER
jgi:hypothetical protein